MDHCEEPVEQSTLGGHIAQISDDEAAVALENVPGEQGVQAILPGAVLKVPDGHGLQSVGFAAAVLLLK